MGESMRTVCAIEGMPSMSTVFKWLREIPEFTQQYTRAKEESADVLAEDIISIADDGTNDTYKRDLGDGTESEEVNFDHIQRSKLRVEARKWIAAKLKPKKYGDKIQQEHVGANGGPLFVIQAPKRIDDLTEWQKEAQAEAERMLKDR